MSLQYMEQSDIVFMREPNSTGVYRVLKNRRPSLVNNLYIHPNTVLVDAETMKRVMGNDRGLKVSWYSIRMVYMESNFELA